MAPSAMSGLRLTSVLELDGRPVQAQSLDDRQCFLQLTEQVAIAGLLVRRHLVGAALTLQQAHVATDYLVPIQAPGGALSIAHLRPVPRNLWQVVEHQTQGL